MFEEDLVGEVQRLIAESQPLGRTARQALGYRQVIDYLENRQSLPDTVRLVQTKTRQFAKRQHTWFRNLVEGRAVEMSGDESPSELAERILAADDP
jgi:tRNA dimethylallyltransferase